MAEDDPLLYMEDSVTPPDTRVGKHLAWVIKVLNGEAQPGDLNERFTDRFLEVFPKKETETTLTTLRDEAFDGKPIDLVQINEEEINENAISGFLRGRGTRRTLSVFIATDENTGKIAGLQFNRAGYSPTPAGDFESMKGEMGEMEGGSAFGSYEIVADEKSPKGYRLRPVYEYSWDERKAIAASFHLFIAAAAAEAVASGNARWDEGIPVKERWKCLPNGRTSSLPAGTELSLSELLDRMLVDSDTTAADHIFHRVGREAVETTFKNVVVDPRKSLPLLSTRELFAMKIAADDFLRDDYRGCEVDVRREMLAEGGEVEQLEIDWAKLDDWNLPRAVETIEYFTTCKELCGAMAELRRLEQLPGMEPLSKSLRSDPGMEINRKTWTSVAYKGGTEPGVLSHVWLLQRDDGRFYTMAVIWNNPERNLEDDRLMNLAKAGINLLEKDRLPQPHDKPHDKKAADQQQPLPTPAPTREDGN